jgi:hypothetical protein
VQEIVLVLLDFMVTIKMSSVTAEDGTDGVIVSERLDVFEAVPAATKLGVPHASAGAQQSRTRSRRKPSSSVHLVRRKDERRNTITAATVPRNTAKRSFFVI